MKFLTVLFFAHLALRSPAKADICNFHATLIEEQSFYFTEKFSRKVKVDIENYVEAFPKLDKLVTNFERNLELYGSDAAINATEPLPLIPFTIDQNIYKIDEERFGKDAIKACQANGGSIIHLTNENRPKIVEILKKQEMEKTPIFALPFFSLMTYSDLEYIETPSDVKSIAEVWLKSPPMLHKDNSIIYPHGKNTLGNVTVSTTAEEFKSKVLCTKAANPWDFKDLARESWLKLVPKIRSTIRMLNRLKNSYDVATRVLQGIGRKSEKVTNMIRLSLPEPFQEVLGFLDHLKKKKNWEKLKFDATTKFHKFMQAAARLARLFELKTNSFTQISDDKPKFSPPSIIGINWRDHLGLDEELYGISGPLTITPEFAHAEENYEGVPVLFTAKIDANIYNRHTNKITLYRVKPNVYNQEAAQIKTLIVTPRTKVAVDQEIEPLQCEAPSTEIYKVCQRMPYHSLKQGFMPEMTKCAFALMSADFSTDFLSCPRVPVEKGTTVYRAECGSELEPTVIVNSDQPVMLDFVCDGARTEEKNFSSFPSFIKTDCEVHILDGAFQKMVLPQWNHDLLQDPTVGEIFTPASPVEVSITWTEIAIVSAISFSAAVVLTVAVTFTICCSRRRRRARQLPQGQQSTPPFIPLVRIQELQFLE